MAWTAPRTWVSGELVTAALLNTHIRDNQTILKTAINDSGEVEFTDATELTIASGAITVTQNYHKIDTQSDAGTDDLDTITAGTNVAAGFVLHVRPESGARTVVLKNGTSGSDNLNIGTDITLDEEWKTYSLIFDGTNWRPFTIDASAAVGGSDTQVQYNDGGSFAGDAGLVYNASTDVLTAGKLATTDTSATSIDVAGGITAGTGNVAIVNAAGKIPALSSTYLASLDGSALTGISAGAWTTYATTVTDLVNSTTDTTVLTSTAIGAGDFTLGSVLIIWCTYTVNNQTGGNQTVTLSLGLEESGTYRSHQSDHTWEAPAATRQQAMQFIFQRKDSDEIFISLGSESVGHVGSVFGNPGNGNCKSAGSINFSNACTPIVKVKFATASANLGIDMHSGMVALITAGT